MRNPIFQYSVVSESSHSRFGGAPSHAAHKSNLEVMLCGVSRAIFGCASSESLAGLDGVVSCPECMRVLQERGVGSYAGPLGFLPTSVVKNGVLLDYFSVGIFDQGYEDFFAHGHHAPGVVLGIAREMFMNRLEGWEELQTTVYAHWSASIEAHEKDGPFCRLTWHKTADEEGYNPTIKVFPRQITVIRHEAWPLLEKHGTETEHACRRLKAWYLGSTKLGRVPTPDDLDIRYTRGYTVCGVPSGSTENTCLEWPTAYFEEAMQLLGKWEVAGATGLKLVGWSCGISLEELRAGGATIIRHGIREHGRDFPFWEFLDMYQLAER
ncbi:TPA: hypothetical protein ACP3ZG_001578 [Pseudomonas aeruginosa]|uniref:Uncharacterized protein n=1 Tax=Pseudomonas aeruginosa TaxID=287 RepID=A0A241XRZ8_PSEAI|nr:MULTISPECIES: hypothetical protein [Pseudomonas]ELG7182087.1 hypothetical protein [Pseudomonas aeruginosa]MBH4094944.1 hypothetical protein [Pseudomonas aeruginosa]MBI6603339.1 hypothetical protein [Pseudomonas sp. S4_EA_1b]MBI8852534.1 hypothetical protein [Pseudomonas aeruginosa]OBY57609.1 hypothetical protein A9513_003010 [Pseudomonas sp. AU12215]